jgi:hypothetical protein
MGIEPTYPAWKAGVLPLNYTRIYVKRSTPGVHRQQRFPRDAKTQSNLQPKHFV